MKNSVLCMIPLTTALLAGSRAMADTVYNAADDFSASSNPNGVWTFGQRATISGTFSAFVQNGTVTPGVDFWAAGTFPSDMFNGAPDGLPGAFHNSTGAAIPNWVTTVNMPVNALNLHPGSGGAYSVARFTVPADGTYTYSVNFEALARDGGGTSSDVHLFANSTEQYAADFGNAALGTILSSGSFSGFFSAGDFLEVRVGRGANGTYFSDSTGVDFTVVQMVPLPAGAYAGLSGLIGVAGLGISRRRRA